MTEAGPLGEETARLLAAAQDWLHRLVLDPATAKVATGSAECCWCPLCQLIAAARGSRPELTERLSEALGALTELQAALAGLLRRATEPAAAGEPTPPAERPARTVHRIDLSGEPATARDATEPATARDATEPATARDATEPATARDPTEPANPDQDG